MAEGKGQAFLDKFAEVSAKVGNQVHLRTLRDAFATITPLYILAGIAVLINNVVFPLFFAEDSAELAAVQGWGSAVTLGTLSACALILAGLIGHCLAVNKRFENSVACVVVGISSFIIMMPQAVTATLGNLLVATNADDKLADSMSYAVADLGVKLSDGYALTGVEASGVLSTTNTDRKSVV